MQCAWINFQHGSLDQLGREKSRGADRHDLVVVAVKDQRRHTSNFLRSSVKSVSENALMQSKTALVAGLHPLEPERVASAPARPWRPAGWRRRTGRWQILEELRAVGEDAGANTVEHLHRQAAGIGGGFQHQRRHGADQHGLGDTLRAVAADIAGNFAAARGDGRHGSRLFRSSVSMSSERSSA